jgi:uncharacterized membrane protein
MIDFDLKIRVSLNEETGAMRASLEVSEKDQAKLRGLPSLGVAEAAEACLIQALRLQSLVGVADLKQRALRINVGALGEQVQKSMERMISALVPGVARGVLEETGHGNDTGNVP